MNVLEKIIRDSIAVQGFLSMEAYMELALQHPNYGYYRVREPVGRTGDFITAPEVSQMFGEMIGVWCAETWRMMGKPDPFALVELGPGRGTMMRDILRATAHVAGFSQAKQLCLLDSDKALRKQQSEKLSADEPRYIEDIGHLPSMPALIVANEFFDALPVRQFEKTFRGWSERGVTAEKKALVVTQRLLEDSEISLLPSLLPETPPGTIIEISPQAQNVMRDLVRHIATQTGALLMIDYGYVAPSGASTLQAVSNHAYTSIFEQPGEVDLTAHVDFTSLAQVAAEGGLHIAPVIGQGEFLKNMGIDIRADSLRKHATLPQIAEIDAALDRLTDEAQMGSLFKVMEVKG